MSKPLHDPDPFGNLLMFCGVERLEPKPAQRVPEHPCPLCDDHTTLKSYCEPCALATTESPVFRIHLELATLRINQRIEALHERMDRAVIFVPKLPKPNTEPR